jgi:hypothetical protein
VFTDTENRGFHTPPQNNLLFLSHLVGLIIDWMTCPLKEARLQ